MEELKPCPFCGSENISNNDYIRDGRQVSCRSCFASTIAFNPNAQEKACAAWNRRAANAKLVAALTAALPLLEENQECLERSYMPEPSETEAEMLTAYSEAIKQARAALKEIGE